MPRPRSNTLPKPSATGPAAEPVANNELDALFAPYVGLKRIALSVSGGPDSLALMHLSLAWRALQIAGGPEFLVLTLDHGLRPEAAAEAARVADTAARLGLRARILTREPPGSRVRIQETARHDRYRLLSAAARQAGAEALATGHTLDDQAETLLMRLSRGSGVDGLSAMAPVSKLGGLKLLRPLLEVAKARLESSLRARGITWTIDPSNSDPTFERPRLRAAMPALAAAGLAPKVLARSARRLARARAALEQITTEAAARHVTVHDEGYFAIDRRGFESLPEEIRLRLLGRLIARLGTPGRPERMARLERLAAALATEPHPGASLAGCLVKAAGGRILVLREPGRSGLPRLTLRPGEALDWDRRCRVSLSIGSAAEVTIRALEASELHGDLAAAAQASGIARSALITAPSAWRGEALLAMPALALVSSEVAFTPTLALDAGSNAAVHDVEDTMEPQT